MKVLGLLFLVAFTCFSTKAEANLENINQCSSHLKDSYGYTLEIFINYGQTRREACSAATYQCESYRRGQRGLHCETSITSPRPVYITKSCRSNLLNAYGRAFVWFEAISSGYNHRQTQREACREAMRHCRSYKRQRGLHRFRCQLDILR